MTTSVTLIRGDGIGPEVTAAAARVVEAAGAKIDWQVALAGEKARQAHGASLPEATLESIRQNRFCLKGPLAIPRDGTIRSTSVTLRKKLDLFANVRMARTFTGLPNHHGPVDVIVICETNKDLPYSSIAGIGHFIDPALSAAEAASLIASIGPDRILGFAFRLARARGRKRVTLLYSPQILKITSGLFLEVGREMARHYPDLAFTELPHDDWIDQVTSHPSRFDVVVTTDLFGDSLGLMVAGSIGGLPLMGGASFGDHAAIFEVLYGNSLDYVGNGFANPVGAILAGAMMLDALGQKDRALRVESALRLAIADGRDLTPDLGGQGNTEAFTNRVIAALGGSA